MKVLICILLIVFGAEINFALKPDVKIITSVELTYRNDFREMSQDGLIFTIQPNPVEVGENLTITFTQFNDRKNFTVRVLDVLGNKVFRKEYAPAKTIDILITKEKFRSGIYILEIEQGNSVTRKRINVID